MRSDDDVPDLTPKDGEVLIRIEAVGLNFADVMRRRGDDYLDPSPPLSWQPMASSPIR